jgi:hypothetical protein
MYLTRARPIAIPPKPRAGEYWKPDGTHSNRSKAPSRHSNAARIELPTTSAESTCIGTLRSLISDRMRAKLMIVNGWRGRYGVQRASGSAIVSQLLKQPKGRRRGGYLE